MSPVLLLKELLCSLSWGRGGGGAESLTFLPDLSFPTDEKIKLFLVVSLKPRKAISAGFCAELLGGLLCLET